MRILIACEFSGVVRQAFRDLGHDAWSCDLLPAEDGDIHHHQRDCLSVANEPFYGDGNNWDMMIAFPPCTHLCSSGARWFPAKRADGSQDAAIAFFMALVSAPIPRIAIENPIGIMSRLYRKPDQIIQPWQHGHAETKSTCLWLKNLPLLTPTRVVEPDYMRKADGSYYKGAKGKRYSRIHFMSRSHPNRAQERSRTYAGVGKAMASQWNILKQTP